jgi:hypothetical protein
MSQGEIGKVVFDWGDEEMEAMLSHEGIWSSPNPTLTDCLNLHFNLRDYSVADGMPGYPQLHAAAKWLGGSVVDLSAGEIEDLVY